VRFSCQSVPSPTPLDAPLAGLSPVGRKAPSGLESSYVDGNRPSPRGCLPPRPRTGPPRNESAGGHPWCWRHRSIPPRNGAAGLRKRSCGQEVAPLSKRVAGQTEGQARSTQRTDDRRLRATNAKKTTRTSWRQAVQRLTPPADRQGRSASKHSAHRRPGIGFEECEAGQYVGRVTRPARGLRFAGCLDLWTCWGAPYRLGVLLGRGGMGEVFQATDSRLGRSAARDQLKTAEAALAGAEQTLGQATHAKQNDIGQLAEQITTAERDLAPTPAPRSNRSPRSSPPTS
jgi:hypothetical protein